jgi:hypothetical protein
MIFRAVSPACVGVLPGFFLRSLSCCAWLAGQLKREGFSLDSFWVSWLQPCLCDSHSDLLGGKEGSGWPARCVWGLGRLLCTKPPPCFACVPHPYTPSFRRDGGCGGAAVRVMVLFYMQRLARLLAFVLRVC